MEAPVKSWIYELVRNSSSTGEFSSMEHMHCQFLYVSL
jgi:hypothetical protein